MRAQAKTTLRLFRRHIARFITVIAIIIVSVGFMSGIGEVETKIYAAADIQYEAQVMSDLYIKSKSEQGFSQEEITAIEERYGEASVLKSFSYETELGGKVIRVYYGLIGSEINKLELLSGRMPENEQELLAERATSGIKGYALGERVTVAEREYTVVGVVENPLLMNCDEELSFQYENRHLSNVIYINDDFAVSYPDGYGGEIEFTLYNDIYVTFADRTLFNHFSDGYEGKVDSERAALEGELGEDRITVLSLFENAGLYAANSYGEKVGIIGIVFVGFFLLVTMLVVYSTMTRLLDEERGQIACMKTLGYSSMKIVGKYVLFVAVAALIGGIAAYGVGLLLTWVIYSAFSIQYAMPAFPAVSSMAYYFITFALTLVTTSVLTLITGLNIVNKKPVTLLVPKAPKAGKKVFLERISLVWNRLSFKYKSTVRNVLLFKSRFFMTVVSVTGSSVLVFAGMGLMNCALKRDDTTSLVAISAVIIAFSAALCALVIYNLTNINVSERGREIATLMVLGYQDNEVCGYIYREIYIMSFIGAILGIPCGLWFVDFAFSLIDFGNIADIHWSSYVLTPIITMIFSFISTLLLRKKIVGTDMNASLKSLE